MKSLFEPRQQVTVNEATTQGMDKPITTADAVASAVTAQVTFLFHKRLH